MPGRLICLVCLAILTASLAGQAQTPAGGGSANDQVTGRPLSGAVEASPAQPASPWPAPPQAGIPPTEPLPALPADLVEGQRPSVPVPELPAADRLSLADPDLRARADAGDPYALFDLAQFLAGSGLAEDQRAAIALLTRAEGEAARLQGDEAMMAGILAQTRGRLHYELSEYAQAARDAGAAETIYRRFQHMPDGPRAVGTALEDHAFAMQRLERHAEALDMIAEAREFYAANEPPDRVGVASTWLNQGISHEGLDIHDDALTDYHTALTAYSALEDEGLGPFTREASYLANNIGWVWFQAGDMGLAREWLEMALPIMVETEGAWSENVGKVHINLGLVAARDGRPDEAIAWVMKALPYIRANPVQTLDDQRWAYDALSMAFERRGEVVRAIFFGKMAVNAQQTIRATNASPDKRESAALRAEWGRLYNRLADLLIAEGRISEAQAVLNMEKEDEVFDFLRRDASADLSQTRADLTEAETGEAARLDALSGAPVAAERELRGLMALVDAGTATPADEDRIFALQDALQTASDQFDAEVAAFLAAMPAEGRVAMGQGFDAVGSYQAVLETLPRPTAILQVATLDDAVHLFLTLPGVTVHRKVDIARPDLARMVFDALQAIESVSPEAEAKLAALYPVLFGPVAQTLEDSGTEVVMLNLDGFLRYVPFAALHDGNGWLVERYAFALYSPAVPTQFARAERGAAETAGFGVTAAWPGFSPLPGVERELGTIFGAGGVLHGQTGVDGAFDERSLRRALIGRPAILHIASHFALKPGREDDSFLLLGDGSHLPLSKIRSTRALRFQGVDLLTLSACQTARGGDGAEIDGFGATAQLNGAGAVMASLWPVSDAATPRLMRDFYAGLVEGGLDKAEALRQAQIAMLREARAEAAAGGAERSAVALDAVTRQPVGMDHPYFWSAFVLMGNWL